MSLISRSSRIFRGLIHSSPAVVSPGWRLPHRCAHSLETGNAEEREQDIADAVLDKIEAITPTVRLLTLQLDSGAAQHFKFRPGMWVDFYIPAIDKVGGYSMVSLPEELPLLQLAVKVTRHPPAAWIGNCAKPGDRVILRAGGSFHLGDLFSRTHVSSDVRHLLLVAGGIGINPLYCMTRQFVNACCNNEQMLTRHLTLMYSSRTRCELPFLNEMQELQSRVQPHGNMDLHVHVTQESSRIGEAHLAAALDNCEWPKEASLCYVCGPPAMTDGICNHLDQLGLRSCQVRAERWW
jgi:NAD(P)H-flavin reductase